MDPTVKEYIKGWIGITKYILQCALFVAVVALILYGTFWANIWFIRWAVHGG